MLKISILLFLLLNCTALLAQETQTSSNRYAVSDTIKIDTIALNKSSLKIFDSKNQLISAADYYLNKNSGILTFHNTMIKRDSITVLLTIYPEFLTRAYSIYENPQVMDNAVT